MTSLRPASNMRPCVIVTFPRTVGAAASTPRKGTLASVLVERLGTSMITNSSADATAAPFSRATPGASLTIRATSRPRPLDISLFAPSRRTIAMSSRPVDVTARRNPCAIDRTPTNTTTTPAMPAVATMAEPLRRGMVHTPNHVTAAT